MDLSGGCSSHRDCCIKAQGPHPPTARDCVCAHECMCTCDTDVKTCPPLRVSLCLTTCMCTALMTMCMAKSSCGSKSRQLGSSVRQHSNTPTIY